MTRSLLIAAFACLTPMLFMSMNVDVHPNVKFACKATFAILLLAAFCRYLFRRQQKSA